VPTFGLVTASSIKTYALVSHPSLSASIQCLNDALLYPVALSAAVIKPRVLALAGGFTKPTKITEVIKTIFAL
jgi:hypothetical protein